MRVWEGSMRWQGRAATASGITSSFLTIALPAAALWMSLTAGSSHAADLVWDVENPFRFFKPAILRSARGCVQCGARRSVGSAAAGHHLAHRTGAQRSRLQGRLHAGPMRGNGRQALSAEPTGMGGADAGGDLL